MTGRFGGRVSEKAGERDVLAMDEWKPKSDWPKDTEPHDWQWIGPITSWFKITERRAKEYADRQGGTASKMNISAIRKRMSGKDEYRDEAAENKAQSRGYREDMEQVKTGPTRPERLEFKSAGAVRRRTPEEIAERERRLHGGDGRWGGRGSDEAGGRDFATDPPVSQAQRAAMHEAAEGKSTLGIPKSVGQEFANADPGGKLPAKARY